MHVFIISEKWILQLIKTVFDLFFYISIKQLNVRELTRMEIIISHIVKNLHRELKGKVKQLKPPLS